MDEIKRALSKRQIKKRYKLYMKEGIYNHILNKQERHYRILELIESENKTLKQELLQKRNT
jgi:hypothetical protein